MSTSASNGGLTFFKVDKYHYSGTHICDYRSIPRPHYCMGFIFEGQGIFEFDEESVTVGAGDIIFVPVGSTYISKWSGEDDVVYISAHFSFDYPEPFRRNSKMKIQKISFPDTSALGQSYTDMYERFVSSEKTQFAALSSFYFILSQVFELIEIEKGKKPDKRIIKALEYIEQHYNERISVDELARLCNISPSYFFSLFKESVGCSAIEYKHSICIRQAELMLIDNREMSIESISDCLGFESSIYFRKVFKSITGMTPREYRNIRIE